MPQRGSDRGDDDARRDRAPDRGGHGGDTLRAERDDDEGDLGALEEHRFVRDDHPDPVPFGLRQTLRPELGDLAPVDLLLIVQRDDPREAQDRLAEPTQSEEEEQRPDDAEQQVLGHVIHERDAKRRDDDRERERRQRRAGERRAPPTGQAYREDDGRRLDELDRARDE